MAKQISNGVKSHRIILWGSVILGLALIVVIIAQIVNSGDGSNTIVPTIVEITEQDHVKGNPMAATTLIEYSDFQCPACKTYYSMIKELGEELGENIRIVYRHFPLKSIHKNAELAARVSEAAGLQGKFWEMHDHLYEKQRFWSNERNAQELFIKYAADLELDTAKFQTDLNEKSVSQKVSNDERSGIRSGIRSTPTLFLNGKKINNPRSYDELRSLILDNE